MNMLIYCENGNLTIRKPNGLQYTFENTDKPELGFHYDVLIYDDVECKIMEWDDSKPFEEQQSIALNEAEVDAIETYIENSVPPEHVNLNQQFANDLNNVCHDYIRQMAETYGFTNEVDIAVAGREGSNHPYRSDARRVMEYYDAVWNCYVNVANEIRSTREDTLRQYEDYLNQIPQPNRPQTN